MAAAAIQKLTPLPAIEKLSERVIRVLGGNPGYMTLQGTNTYLVGKGRNKILIDTGSPNIPEYITNLQQALQNHSAAIKEIVITHWHEDHVGGVPNVCKELLKATPEVSKFRRISVPDADISPAQYSFVEDQTVFKADDTTLRAIFTPGHTEEHMILYLEEENAVFAGDTILGESTAVFEDLHSYMLSLQKILDLQPQVIYPGHGIVIQNPMQLVRDYIKHRSDREEQILSALGQSPDQPMLTVEIVRVVYEGIAEVLIPAACKNATQHLLKLVKDDKVVHIQDTEEHRWKLIQRQSKI